MTHTEAELILGVIVGGTSGWNSAPDETFVIYTKQIEALRDFETAQQAALALVRTWDEMRRPSVAAIFAAYTAEVRRTALTKQLPVGHGNVLDPKAGRRVMASAYLDQCRRERREPNWATFEKLAGAQRPPGDVSKDLAAVVGKQINT